MIPPIDTIPKWLLRLWEDESIEQSSIALFGHFKKTNMDRLPEIYLDNNTPKLIERES